MTDINRDYDKSSTPRNFMGVVSHKFNKNNIIRNSVIALMLFTFSSVKSTGFEVGVGRCEITPTSGDTINSFLGEARVLKAEHILHKIFIKTIYLKSKTGDESVIVSLNLLYYPDDAIRGIKEAVANKFGIKNCIISVTHTHSGLFNVSDYSKINKKVLKSIEQAQRSSETVTMTSTICKIDEGYNRRIVKDDGTVEMLWSNRDKKITSPLDNRVDIMCFKTRNGDIKATLITTNTHPVVSLSFKEMVISADYPGVMEQEIERAVGGDAIFFLGAAGDINPYWASTPFKEGSKRKVDELGICYAKQIIPIIEKLKGYKSFELKVTTTVDTLIKKRGSDLKEFGVKSPIVAEVTSIKFGEEKVLCFLSGEFFVEHGIRLKLESEIEHTIFNGYSNYNIGYIPTKQASKEGGYGAKEGVFVESNSGDLLINRTLEMINTKNNGE